MKVFESFQEFLRVFTFTFNESTQLMAMALLRISSIHVVVLRIVLYQVLACILIAFGSFEIHTVCVGAL